MGKLDLDDARDSYFAAGGKESELGPRNDPEWYWRRAAKLWREKKQLCSCGCEKQASMYFANKRHALDHMGIVKVS